MIAPGRLQGGGKRSKAEIADYVLVYRNHKLAVIEAKKRDTPVGEGVGQAKAYANKLAMRFTYATNGLTITRYNDVGTVVTGNTFANRNSLRSLKIRFIGIGEQNISRGGDSRSVIQDTLTTVVTLRNVKQN